MKEDIKDKKFLRKMEENVQLLNQLAKVTSGSNNFQERIRNLNNNNNSTYNINEYSKLNKSYIRSHNMSLNSSQNINNSNYSFMNNNKVYSKNRFEDILSKMYKTNALKIHKIIQNK
jgi:predicted nuclease with TOPRIM domain